MRIRSVVGVGLAVVAVAASASSSASAAEPLTKYPDGSVVTRPQNGYPYIPDAGSPNASAAPIVVKGVALPGGGVKVGNDRVAYDGGAAYLVVDDPPATKNSGLVAPFVASYPPCGTNLTCLYRDNNFTGSPNHFEAAGGGNYQLSAYGFNDVTSSWINNRSNTARLYDDWTCSGSCGPSGSYFTMNPDTHAASIGSWNDQGSGLKII
jgi:hypothetical protein